MAKKPKRSEIRFLSISLLLVKLDSSGSTRSAIAEVIETVELSHSIRLNEKTLYRWLSRYHSEGWAFREDKPRKSSCFALKDEFVEFLKQEKENDPPASIPEIIKRARASGIISEDCAVDRSTVYRAARRLNLPFVKHASSKMIAKPFSYKHRMQMLLCDGKHFRANGKKRVAFFYLDDATRHILGVKVSSSESSAVFIKGLYEVISKYGLMERIYVDHGSAFNCNHVKSVSIKLDVPVILGKVGYPEGRGKVERFNQTVFVACLRSLDKDGIDSSYASLTLRIEHYLKKFYSQEIHSELGIAPQSAFHNDTRTLKFLATSNELEECFCIRENRKVRSDNCITYNGVIYQLPYGYAGKRINLDFNLIKQTLHFISDTSSILLHEADPEANARRAPFRSPKIDPKPPDFMTAAEIAFNKDFQPIVDHDGGFSNSSNLKE